jgi:hypothetical protein
MTHPAVGRKTKKNGAVLAPLNFPEGKSHGTAIEIAA